MVIQTLLVLGLVKPLKMIENHIEYLLSKSKIGISKQQWIALNLINSKNGLSQNKLSKFINIDKTSVSRFLNTMIKKGLIEKKFKKR